MSQEGWRWKLRVVTKKIYMLVKRESSLTRVMSFEEALEAALAPKEPGSISRWVNFREFRRLREYKGRVYESDGVKGYFLWRSSEGYLYEADYSSKRIFHDRAVEYISVPRDRGEYYVWEIVVVGEKTLYVDASTGEVLLILPGIKGPVKS